MKKIYSLFFFAIFALPLSFLFQACKQDPEIFTNTVIETDTLFITATDTLVVTELDTIFQTDTVTLTEVIKDTLTTFILVRHAETTGIGSDPDLSVEGLARAAALTTALESLDLSAVFSTDLQRTLQTAEVVANDQSLPVETYEPFVLDPLVDDVLENHHQGSVLVVGHSNTTPSLLNLLVGAETYDLIPEEDYNNLFVVSVFEKGRAEVTHLKYGE